MSDSPLRKRTILVKCPRCLGFKGIYGKSAMGYPATLPCPRCINSSGEVDLETLTEEEKQV
jgi:hypothetical protein